jgi:hypothetical protein
MRKRTIIAAVAGLMMLGGPALADGVSGSTEHHQDCKTNPDGTQTCTTVYDNNVKCGTGTKTPGATPAGTVTVSGLPSGGTPGSSGGLEVCTDDSSVLQGRIIASGSATDQSGYVAVDGDKDNKGDPKSQGWARIDGSKSGVAVRCGDANGRKDATEPTADDTQADCG